MTPNLDCMSPEELGVYALLTDGPLGRYASTKAQAMRYRLAGDIQRALNLEQRCDEIYQTLPKNLKW